MQPSPPKQQKARKYVNRPFYEPNKKTSAEIISEARSSVRALETKRPFTPAETSRTLFETRSDRDKRPPSSVSIASSYTESRPPTGKRLSPIHGLSELNIVGSRIHLDQDDGDAFDDFNNNDESTSSFPSTKEHITPKPPVSSEPKFSKSARRPIVQRRITAPALIAGDSNRRVHSGPKERTKNSHETIVKRSSSFNDLSSDSIIQDKSNIYFEENVRPLLEQMSLNHLHDDADALLVNFDVLWKTLQVGSMLGKSKLGSKRRSEMLTYVFKCTNHSNAHLLLKLSRLFLALEVSGKNLEVVSKLMFKVSRNKKYDVLFIEEKLIEPLLHLFYKTSEIDLNNCLVYLAGTLKFLTLNKTCLEELIKHNVLKHIASLLYYAKENLSSDPALNKDSCHMLVQITSSLSNLANIESEQQSFISHDIISLLLDLTQTRYEDVDYYLNISRIFSKLTMSAQICEKIEIFSNSYKILLSGLQLHLKKKDIAVRMCYAFGNIADFVASSRQTISIKTDGKKVFLKIADYYNTYLFKLLKGHEVEDISNDKSDVEDVLIKVTRVIANLSIDEKCGEIFSNSVELIQIFNNIIGMKKQVCDQLVINIAATVNNLSYFASENSALTFKQKDFSKVFLELLLSTNIDCVLEMVRVLGNFSQSKAIRELILRNKVFEVMIALLDSNNPDMIVCTCGVLINMMVDEPTRPMLKTFGGISKLIDVLKDLAESDWILAGMVCQILWNYSEKITRAVDFFGLNETDDLLTVLNELLEPELSLDYENHEDLSDETIEFLMTSWEEDFKPVALLLLNRIESHHSELEPLVAEPD